MQSYVIFTCALTLLLKSLHVLAQNDKQVSDDTFTLVQLQMSTSRDKHQLRDVTNNLATLHNKNLILTSDNKNLKDQLNHVTSQHQTLEAKCKSQEDETKLMREQLEINNKQMQEIDALKLQLQETQSCKEAVSNGFTDIKSIMNTRITPIHKTDSFNYTSESEITDKIEKVLLKQSKLSADIQAVSKSVSEEKTCQTQNKDMLTQVLTKLEQHDLELKSHRQQNSELLNTTTLNGKRYYFSFEQPRMSWYDAGNFCRSHGMQLVSVESREEWTLLKPEVKKLLDKSGLWPWSFGSDAAEEGHWKWTATGSDVIFYAGRNMNGASSQNCMFLATDSWNDLSCTNERSFICQANSHN